MRGFAIVAIFMLFASSLWVSACATGGGGGGPAERLIRAQPQDIVEAVGIDLQGDGLRRISRSDHGDLYERQFTARELSGHSALAEIAQNGDMTMRAQVSRSRIEVTSSFPDTDTEVGFAISLTPTDDGLATMARLEPLVRGSGAEANPELIERMNRSFSSRGRQLLAGIAATVEI